MTATTAIILLVVTLGAGCNNWRGFGFHAMRTRDAAAQAGAGIQAGHVGG